MADHRCRKRNDDDHEGGDTDDRAVGVPVMVGSRTSMSRPVGQEEAMTEFHGSRRTVTQSIESEASRDEVVGVLVEATRIPEWAPAFVDRVTGDARSGWLATKDGQDFALRVVVDQGAGTVDYLREVGPRTRGWGLRQGGAPTRGRKRHRDDFAVAARGESDRHRGDVGSGTGCARRPRRAPLNSASTTLPRSDVVQAAGGEVFGPGGWALISSANLRNFG